MDWGEIWLSDDDGGNLEEEDEYPGHPTSFTLGLTYRGQEGDFHGFESRKRALRMIRGFEEEVETRTGAKVKVASDWNPEETTSSLKPDGNPTTSYAGGCKAPPAQTWIDNMERFRDALMSIHRLRKKSDPFPRVKVALIDDGVDLLSLETHTVAEAITGMSHVPPEGGMERPWHQSTEGHGTVMANMIMRINPWISLDVMRIHGETDSVSGARVRMIFADSAAAAIEDAITREVDIISMSWTVRDVASTSLGMSNGPGAGAHHHGGKTTTTTTTSSYEASVLALYRAIARARDRRILMFCSAADDIQRLGRDSLPFYAAPSHIFRIGASLPLGQRDPASEDARSISYFFPGNKVAEAAGRRTLRPVEYYNGSSVSTALAAGLASVILYCVQLVRDHHDEREADSEMVNVFAEWACKLRSRNHMRAAFDNIDFPEHEDKKFLPVWGVFWRGLDTNHRGPGPR